jgi:hypothetical protein
MSAYCARVCACSMHKHTCIVALLISEHLPSDVAFIGYRLQHFNFQNSLIKSHFYFFAVFDFFLLILKHFNIFVFIIHNVLVKLVVVVAVFDVFFCSSFQICLHCVRQVHGSGCVFMRLCLGPMFRKQLSCSPCPREGSRTRYHVGCMHVYIYIYISYIL